VVKIAELLTDKKLIGVGINHEHMGKSDINRVKNIYQKMFKVPVSDPLTDGVGILVDALEAMLNNKK